jgi:hypothetical protein
LVLCHGKYPVASRYEVFFDYRGNQQAQSMVNRIGDSAGERHSRVDRCCSSLVEIGSCIADVHTTESSRRLTRPLHQYLR